MRLVEETFPSKEEKMENQKQKRWGSAMILAGFFIAFAVNRHLRLFGLAVIFAGAWFAFIKNKDTQAAPPLTQKILGWFLFLTGL